MRKFSIRNNNTGEVIHTGGAQPEEKPLRSFTLSNSRTGEAVQVGAGSAGEKTTGRKTPRGNTIKWELTQPEENRGIIPGATAEEVAQMVYIGGLKPESDGNYSWAGRWNEDNWRATLAAYNGFGFGVTGEEDTSTPVSLSTGSVETVRPGAFKAAGAERRGEISDMLDEQVDRADAALAGHLGDSFSGWEQAINPYLDAVSAHTRRESTVSEPGFWDRAGDTAAGAVKQYAAGEGDAMAAMYEVGQTQRDEQNEWYYEEYRRNYDTAVRNLAMMEEDNRLKPGTWSEGDMDSQRRLVEHNRQRLEAMGYVIDEGVQQQATDQARDYLYEVNEAGGEHIERAKAGLGTVGSFAVDAGAAGLQLAMDQAANYALMGGAAGGKNILGLKRVMPRSTAPANLLLAGRALGGGTMQARQEGASIGEQLTYGGAQAALEMALERIGGLDNVYGTGVTSKLTTRLVSRLGKNEVGKFVLGKLVSMNSEGMEEFLSAVISPSLQSIYNEQMPWENYAEGWLEDALYDYLVGSVLGAFGGDSAAVLAGDVYEAGAIDAVIQTGKKMPEGSSSRKLATALDKERGKGYDISAGDLERLNEMTIREQRESTTAERLGFGQQGQTLVRELAQSRGMSQFDVASELRMAYATGRNNLPGTQLDLTNADQKAAYDAGKMDYLAGHMGRGTGSAQWTNRVNKNGEVINNGNGSDIHLRGSGQWAYGTGTEGQVPGVEGGAGQAQGQRWQAVRGRPADGGTAGLSLDGQEVSTKALGIEGGTEDAVLRRVVGGDTDATREARQTAAENGLELVLFAGDNLRVMQTGFDENGRTITVPVSGRAMIVGNKVYVRVDHPRFTAAQLIRHEVMHRRIQNGEVSVDEVWSRVSENMGEGEAQRLAEAYYAAYKGSNMSEAEIMEEIVCDSVAGINEFAGTDREAGAEKLLRATERAVRESEARQEGSADAKPRFSLERAANVNDLEGVGLSRDVEVAGSDASEALSAVEVNVDAATESAFPDPKFSRETWSRSEYVENRDKAAKELADRLGISRKKAGDYIDSINSIAKAIADDADRLDYEASPGRSSFVGNVEYGGSFDFTTLCPKRAMLTGTFSAIQRALPNTALTANEILEIRNMMVEQGIIVNCGLCYVEGSRANMGTFTKAFIELYKKHNPGAWAPNMAEMNTPDGIEWVRLEHPEVYEQYEYFWNHYGTLREGDPKLFASQQKPKLYQLHTAYNNEILTEFEAKDAEATREKVEAKNKKGGIRLQSFSDFEIVHLIDTMQVIMDMSRVGLAGQAYTKMPDFAWALGDTGLKINLSLIAKDVDANGRLVFDDREGMEFEAAMELRDTYSKNVGTILVVFNDAQLLAAMADDRIDFIIPFHRSQWKKSQYKAMGLPANTKDYTYQQNEKLIKKTYHEYRGRMVLDKATNYMPNDYWDFKKSGKENAEKYLSMCAENNKRPKFYRLLQNNGDGSYSLKPDGSTDGYWKLLIDFKMYDNEGNGSPQMPVRPDFNMNEARRMMDEYRGGHQKFPVAQGIVDEFVKKYKAEHKGQSFSQDLPAVEQMRKDFRQLEAENKRLKAQVEKLSATKMADTVRRGDAAKVARNLLNAYNSTAKPADVGRDIAALGDMLPGGDWYAVKQKAEAIARDIVSSSHELVSGDKAAYAEMRKYLKANPIAFNGRGKVENWNDFKRGLSNAVKFSESGKPVAQVWDKLREIYGEDFFPAEVTEETEQVLHISEVLAELAPVYENPYSDDLAQAVEWATADIIDMVVHDVGLETKEMAQGRVMAEKARRSLESVRAGQEEKIARIKQHHKDVAAAQKARREDSKARTRLLNIARRLRNKKLPAVNRALIDQYIGELDLVAKSLTGKKAGELRGLRDWYYDQRDNNPDFMADPRTEKAIARLSQKQIADMSAEDVADLTDVLLSIEKEITEGQKLIDAADRRDIYYMGLDIIDHIENAVGTSGMGLRGVSNAIVTETLSPIRQMHRITGYNDSDPLYAATNALSAGERKSYDYRRRASGKFIRWTNNKELIDSLAGKNADAIKIVGQDKSGRVEVEITPAMRMSLYLHSLNDQNLRHIVNGGVRVPDIDLYRRGKIAEAYARGTVVRLTPSQVRAIVSKMTTEERAFARAAHDYFNGMSRDEINATSEKLKGYSIAGVEDYYPISTDERFTRREFESLQQDGTIEGMGFLKDRADTATSPIYLRDMTSVLSQAVDMHAKYVGLAIPVRNFNKLWNVTTLGYGDSVKNAVSSVWGPSATKYVEKMMTDLQSRREDPGAIDKVFAAIRSNAAKAAIELGGGVVIGQTAGVPTGASVTGLGPMFKAMTRFGRLSDEAIEAINKHTPLLWMREQGYSTQELGDLASRGKGMPKALNWIQKADIMTVRKLWKVAEVYVEKTRPELAKNSPEYIEAAVPIFERMVEETQPNYTTMQRPQILRSNSAIVQNLQMFKSQSYQNFNIMYDGLMNWRAKQRQYNAVLADKSAPDYEVRVAEAKERLAQAKTNAVRAVTSQLVQNAVFAGMRIVWSALRGKMSKYEDDEGEITPLSFAMGYLGDLLDGYYSMIPFLPEAKEVFDTLVFGEHYYGIEAFSVAAISDAVTAVKSLSDLTKDLGDGLVNGEDINWNDARINATRSAETIANLFGIPLRNARTLVDAAVYQGAKAIGGEYVGEYYSLKLTTPTSKPAPFYDVLYDAYKNDRDDFDMIYSDMVDSGMLDTSTQTTAERIARAMEDRMKEDAGVSSVKDLPRRFKP